MVIEEFQKGNRSEGYRDGVMLVHISKEEAPLFRTYSDFPMFEGMKLSAEYKRVVGREHEPAKVCVNIKELKQSCNYVDIVLYRKDVLEEDENRSTMCEWEIVSINGRIDKEPVPMGSMTIVRNWKHLSGGTEMKDSTSEQVLEMLCKSIMYENGIKNE